MRKRLGIYAVLCTAAAPAAAGDEFRAPEGTRLGRGSRVVTAIEPAGDLDEYSLTGYAGQDLRVGLRVPRGSALQAALELLAPDGRTAAGGRGGLTTELDATGAWILRVRGVAGTTGEYELSVRGSVPRRRTFTGGVPDASRQLRWEIPATGGARLSFQATFRGPAPFFYSLDDPQGRVVLGNDAAVRRTQRRISLEGFRIPARHPPGDYLLRFDANPAGPATDVRLRTRVRLPRGEAPLRGHLDAAEPFLVQGGVDPATGGPGSDLAVETGRLVDPNRPGGSPRLFLGEAEVAPATLDPDGRTLRGRVPLDLRPGTYDVRVETTTGQAAVRRAAWRCVPPPVALDLDPTVGSAAGGFEVTITGANFRPGFMGVLRDGALVPVPIVEETETRLRFTAPPGVPSAVTFAVLDRETGLRGDLPPGTFVYVDSPAVGRVVPSLTPVLGGDTIGVRGANFGPDDRLHLETATPGVFEDLATTYAGPTLLTFTAPPRPRGSYELYVTDALGVHAPGTPRLTYFSYAEFTAGAGLGGGADSWDAWASTLADFDRDGDEDLFLARRGSGPAQPVAQTRALRNDGAGRLTDATTGDAGVMPSTAQGDDWRAEALRAADVNADGWPDLVLVTADASVPPAGRSRVRLLVSERRFPDGPLQDRVFRDRTIDLMAPVRSATPWQAGPARVADDWRGLDLWVGDLDVTPGPPEILVVADEVFEDLDVTCGNYCGALAAYSLSYSFYWGGTRAFLWDRSRRGGLGQYRFDHVFFPRRSGVTAPRTLPGGGNAAVCNADIGSPCRGTFTPFRGRRLAVGRIDGDAKPDVAVVTEGVVQKNGQAIPSLQVGLNRFDPSAGAAISDVTPRLALAGGDFRGRAVAVGHTGWPDGNAFGFLAVARAAASGGPALRLVRYRPPAVDYDLADFEDVSDRALPAVRPDDAGQASSLAFADVDADGDEDLVLLAPAPPGGTGMAFRILRNETAGGEIGVLTDALRPLLTPLATASQHFEGDALALGDLDGDGAKDFVVSRASPTGGGSQTRIVRTDR